MDLEQENFNQQVTFFIKKYLNDFHKSTPFWHRWWNTLTENFLTHFTKKFCRFLTPKVKSGTNMINPSIESSNFLKQIWSWIFENFVGNRQNQNFLKENRQNGNFCLTYISKLNSDPIEKKLWHFEVRVVTGGETQQFFQANPTRHFGGFWRLLNFEK